MATEEEIEAKRAARKAGLAEQRKEQRAKDLAALDELEIEHGDDMVVSVAVERYVPGLPTLTVFRIPKPSEVKRWQSQARDRGDKVGDVAGAHELLCAACRLYPDADVFKVMREHFTAFHMACGDALTKAAMGKAAEEGKG